MPEGDSMELTNSLVLLLGAKEMKRPGRWVGRKYTQTGVQTDRQTAEMRLLASQK